MRSTRGAPNSRAWKGSHAACAGSPVRRFTDRVARHSGYGERIAARLVYQLHNSGTTSPRPRLGPAEGLDQSVSWQPGPDRIAQRPRALPMHQAHDGNAGNVSIVKKLVNQEQRFVHCQTMKVQFRLVTRPGAHNCLATVHTANGAYSTRPQTISQKRCQSHPSIAVPSCSCRTKLLHHL